jgi:response regulator RpfG family c-di-GMP phosphodiesterase
MEDERGRQFDPGVLDAFLSKRSEIIEVQLNYANEG